MPSVSPSLKLTDALPYVLLLVLYDKNSTLPSTEGGADTTKVLLLVLLPVW